MKSYLAIVLQTMRSAIRSKVFHVLAILILLSVILLPLTSAGDGTAISLVQISVTFSLGITVALISATALWLSCSQLSIEIEKYSIHLVVVKPCPKYIIWLGKWTGIFILHAAILFVSSIIIFLLIQARIQFGDFPEADIAKLNSEVRVGRMGFLPLPPDLTQAIKDDVEKNRKPDSNIATLKEEAKHRLLAQDGEVRAGNFKEWTFTGIKTDKDKIFLRFRIFSGSVSTTDQPMMYFTWTVKDPSVNAADPFFEIYPEGKGDQKFHSAKGGSFQEWELDSKYIDPENHSVTIRFYNNNNLVDNFGQSTRTDEIPDNETEEQKTVREQKDAERIDKAKIAILQRTDGPVLLIAEASFITNYTMAIIQALLQIAFLVALGCAVSSAFSTPVAAFVAITYLLIGLSVQAAIDAPFTNDDGSYKYRNVAERYAHYLSRAVDVVVVSVNDFNATQDLARGRLVTNKRIEKVNYMMRRNFESPFIIYPLGTFILLLRWIAIFGLGIWIFQKRELGSVIRK